MKALTQGSAAPSRRYDNQPAPVIDAKYEIESSGVQPVRSDSVTIKIPQAQGIAAALLIVGAIFGHQTAPTKLGAEFLFMGLIVGFGFGVVIKDWMVRKVWQWVSKKK